MVNYLKTCQLNNKLNNLLKVFFISISLVQTACASDTYYYQNNNQKYITPAFNVANRSNPKIDYYLTDNNQLIGVSNKLIIKLNDNTSIQKYLDEYGLILVKKITENTFLLQTSNKNLTLEIANRLHEKQDVEYAHPDFIKRRIKR